MTQTSCAAIGDVASHLTPSPSGECVMQRLSGVLLICFGTAVAAYSHVWSPTSRFDATVVDASGAAPSHTAPLPDTGSLRSFAPTSAAFRAHDPIPRAVMRAPDPTPRPWAAVVTAEASTALKSSKPADFETRFEITRDLQRELKRVGCYGGEITGSWSSASRAAMSEFIDRVNATLPVDEPDYILLTLVQGYAGSACGLGCPAGQAMSASHRCVPHAVLAQAGRSRKAARSNKVAAHSTSKRPPIWQRNNSVVAAGRGDATRVAAVQPRAAGHVVVASDTDEKLPWLENRTTADTRSIQRRELPPGRMAIGGPLVAPSAPPSPVGSQKLSWEPIPTNDPDGTPENVTTSIPKQVANLADEAQGESIAGEDPESARVAAPQKPPKARRKASRSKSSRYARRYYADNGARFRRGFFDSSTIRYNLTLSTRGIF